MQNKFLIVSALIKINNSRHLRTNVRNIIVNTIQKTS